MIPGHVEVEGLQELDDALAQLPQELRRPVLLRALRRAARPIVREARLRAARGTDPRRRGSKKQRASGESAAIGPGADSIAARAERAQDPHSATVAVGPDAAHWYMRFLEFRSTRQRRQPFLTPAFEANKTRAVTDIGDELWRALSAAAKRLARRAETGKLSRRERKALSR